MIKIISLFFLILFIVPVYFVSDAIGQDNDCRAIRDNLKVLRADYRSKYDEYRKSYDKTRGYHN